MLRLPVLVSLTTQMAFTQSQAATLCAQTEGHNECAQEIEVRVSRNTPQSASAARVEVQHQHELDIAMLGPPDPSRCDWLSRDIPSPHATSIEEFVDDPMEYKESSITETGRELVPNFDYRALQPYQYNTTTVEHLRAHDADHDHLLFKYSAMIRATSDDIVWRATLSAVDSVQRLNEDHARRLAERLALVEGTSGATAYRASVLALQRILELNEDRDRRFVERLVVVKGSSDGVMNRAAMLALDRVREHDEERDRRLADRLAVMEGQATLSRTVEQCWRSNDSASTANLI